MANIMDMFKTAPAAPVTPTPGNIPPNTGATSTPTPGTAPNGVIPAVDPNAPAPNPLDAHKTLWDTPTNADGTPIVAAPAELFNVDAQQLMEAAGKVDFSKVIKPEQLAAITAGGEGASQALVAMLNATAQNVYAQSAFATTEIVKQAIKTNQETQDKSFDARIKSLNLNESLRNENPVFSHPAAAPIINAIQQQLAIKNPGASTAELKQMAKDYVANFAASVAPVKPSPAQVASSKETDWGSFLESN